MPVLEKDLVTPKQHLSALLEKSRDVQLKIEVLSIQGYEKVLKVSEPVSQLMAVIAIHDTTLGPALGGVRIQPYPSFHHALEDALRLSKGMTYKSAVAEVGFGGGKSVILADPKTEKTPEKLLAFAKAVESLGGLYICAEDAGCTTDDCRMFRAATKYVVGLPHAKSSGNPSPFTAWGVFRGIQSAAKWVFGTDALEGKKVAIQGLGSVGFRLAELLFWSGAKLIVADADRAKVAEAAARFGAKTTLPQQIFSEECDLFVPCALGGILNDETIPQLRCQAVAGAANNQLLRDAHAYALKERGILYAPDFVINAGGLLNVASELDEGGYCPSMPRQKTSGIYDCLLSIYEIADKSCVSTHEAALSLADYRIRYGIGKRSSPPVFHHTTDA